MTLVDDHNSLTAIYIESLHIVLAVIYRPPASPEKNFETVMDKLQGMIDSHSQGERCPEIYVTGDFNLPLFDWTQSAVPDNPPSSAYRRLMIFLETNFLTQLVTEPTRGSNTLDLILTNRSQDIIQVNVEPTKLSDHKIVECLLGFNPLTLPVQAISVDPFSFRALNYHSTDLTAVNDELGKVDWYCLKALCDSNNDVDGTMFKELIVLTVLQVTLKHCPPKLRPKGAGKSKYEKELVSLKMKRRKLNRKIGNLKRNCPQSASISSLERDVNLISYEIKDTILNQLNQKEARAVSTIKSNPKYFYSYAKRLAKTKSTVAPLKNTDGLLTNDAKEKAEILQSQYVSVFSDPDRGDWETCKRYMGPVNDEELTDMSFGIEDMISAIKELDPYSATPDGDIPARILCSCKDNLALPLLLLWQSSFDSGTIPAGLKTQYITPLFKKGNKTDAANYRPVSLTSHLIKIFERVMRNRLVDFLEENSLLPSNQHGFRKTRSCLTQLIEHIDTVLRALNEGNEVDVIYLDYSKAFDKVDHKILLQKMRHYGIKGKFYAWVENFLTNRKQAVVVDGTKSDFEDVKSGVPQGTVLGPVFFILYVIDMIIAAKNSKALTFADDTKLIKIITYLLCKTLLEADVIGVTQWSISNNMLLHQDKFLVMNYCLNSTLSLRNLPFTAETRQYCTSEGCIIEASPHIRDLGVYVSDDCSWTYHVNMIAAEARQVASWVLGAFRDRTILTMTTLFKSLVRSKLEYCCPLWNPSKIKDIQILENVQKQFTRRIEGLHEMDYWDRLKKLKLLSLQRRRERYTIIHTWKILNGKAPNNINMSFYTSARLGVRATIPSFNYKAQRSISTAFDDSFGVKAARLWNILPKDVNTTTSLESLKSALGNFIAKFPDKPPVPGYTPPNSNSLLDWCAARENGVCA